MSISTPSPNDVASTSRRWREGRDSAVAETLRDAFDAIEHNDAQATRASSSASRPNDAPTSTSSCAERRLSSLHRVIVTPSTRHRHTHTHKNNRRRVLTPRTPSRDSLDEAAETSPRPRADWTPRRRLKFYGRRLADDSLSDNQIRRLREGLLGEYGLNWIPCFLFFSCDAHYM